MGPRKSRQDPIDQSPARASERISLGDVFPNPAVRRNVRGKGKTKVYDEEENEDDAEAGSAKALVCEDNAASEESDHPDTAAHYVDHPIRKAWSDSNDSLSSDDKEFYDELLSTLATDKCEEWLNRTPHDNFVANHWAPLLRARPELNYIEACVHLDEHWAKLSVEKKESYRREDDVEMGNSSGDPEGEGGDESGSGSSDTTNSSEITCQPCVLIHQHVDTTYNQLAAIRSLAEHSFKSGRTWMPLDILLTRLEAIDQRILAGGDSGRHDFEAGNHVQGAWRSIETAIDEVKMHVVRIKGMMNGGKRRVRCDVVMRWFESHL